MRFNIRGWRIIIFEISSPKYFEELKAKLLQLNRDMNEEYDKLGKGNE